MGSCEAAGFSQGKILQASTSAHRQRGGRRARLAGRWRRTQAEETRQILKSVRYVPVLAEPISDEGEDREPGDRYGAEYDPLPSPWR